MWENIAIGLAGFIAGGLVVFMYSGKIITTTMALVMDKFAEAIEANDDQR